MIAIAAVIHSTVIRQLACLGGSAIRKFRPGPLHPILFDTPLLFTYRSPPSPATTPSWERGSATETYLLTAARRFYIARPSSKQSSFACVYWLLTSSPSASIPSLNFLPLEHTRLCRYVYFENTLIHTVSEPRPSCEHNLSGIQYSNTLILGWIFQICARQKSAQSRYIHLWFLSLDICIERSQADTLALFCRRENCSR